MLSLPLVIPRDDVTAWLHPSHRQTQTFDAPETQEHSHAVNGTRRTQGKGHSALAQLIADENAIEQRKQNVRRFGAGWIRPPGIAKTYQATMDEIAEREEQEMLARRDAQMAELANAQEMEARRQQALEAGEDMDGQVDAEDEGLGERDLDEDVPEAEDVTFNEESLLEGSIAPGEADATGIDMDADLDDDLDVDVERMLEMEEAEMAGMLEDLDADVPEAGSYQHTDTELEDDTSEDEIGEASIVRMSGGRARQSIRSENDTHMMSSSFMSSSPAARQGLARGNAFRERLQREGRL